MSTPPPPPPPSARPSGPPSPPPIRPNAAARAEAIFDAVLDLPAEGREQFMVEECAGDEGLGRRVRALLAAHTAAPDFLEEAPTSPEIEEQLARLKPEEAGDRIGPYKLLQEIGAGGFGTVWMADQEHPVRRRVALKIIKMGMDTKEVIARFEQERQALAMMDHPNIARVFDAGATQYGRPFFVMELVRGVKITDYCDEQGLSTAERIELFIHVCQAVQHAHQKGIIHRDLKPSNILVTINDGEAVPKVIDFGVAKATQGHLTDGTLFTKFEQMIGTPLYMSPEQAEMTSLDVDTRSDIYALGVLLYELLTGRTPIDTVTMAQAGMDEIRRLIREVDPPRPSQRLKTLDGNELTTMAKRRHTEPAKLSGSLRGDLDWIVMKCLEKDRKRRYDTANGLALDLQRHLKNEVVIARPPTTGYLLSKLIKRNKSAVAAGCTVAMALIIGFAVAVWQARRANREATRSTAALDELRATAPAFAEQARGLAAKERYDDAIEKLDYAIKLRPDAAEYLVAKADLLQCQLKLSDAAAIYREALRVKPGFARAQASAKLCDELLAAPLGNGGKLSRESLGKLHLAMQNEQRPAAELLPAARLLGEEKAHLIAYWLERLKDLPISPERPLKERLTVRDDSLLELDLQDAKITSLESLAGLQTKLGKLVLWNCKELTDFTPLSEFRSLTYLDLDGTLISDLTPLRGLPLETLYIGGTTASDLSPLQGMKLKSFSAWQARFSDLSPLAGMPLKEFYVNYIPATDFSPLKGAPLEEVTISNSQLRDLSFLEGAPLKSLYLLGCDAVRGWSKVGDFPSLSRLVLSRNYRKFPDEELAAIAALRTHPKLGWIQSDVGEGYNAYRQMWEATQPKEIFWRDWDREQTFLPAIRSAKFDFSLSKLPDDTYSLAIEKQPLYDLSFLKGAPISALRLSGCKVSDLSPISGLPLRLLWLHDNPVADLAPLRGTRIETLALRGGKFTDVTPLTGLPLKELYLGGCKEVADVAPLAQIATLEKVTVPVQARNIDALQKLPELRMLAFAITTDSPRIPVMTAPAFWEMWPKLGWLRALNEAQLKPSLTQLDDGTWEVDLHGEAISDLSILRGAPISFLQVGSTPVSDLSPLRGMPLKKLALYYTKVTDLRPLEGMQLEDLNIGGTEVSDLSVVRGMPLRTLRLHNCPKLTDLSPLREASELRSLTLPPNAKDIALLRDLPKLIRLGFAERSKGDSSPNKTREEFWKEYDQTRWRTALREAGVNPKSVKQLDDGTWEVNLENTAIRDLGVLTGARISRLNVSGTAITDLTPLRDLPLTSLIFHGTKVRDLSPLQGMALDKLQFSGTPVADLTPLRGMPLKSLGLGNTPVADLSPLRGMPLVEIKMRNTAVTDLSPLADSKTIEVISLPANAQDIAFLRDFPNIVRISFNEEPKTYIPDRTAEEFWKEYDERRILSALPGDAGKHKKLADGTWELDFGLSEFSDLTPLKGLSISSLKLGHSEVTDLSPLRGKPLRKLALNDSKVTELSAIQGMPIEDLSLHNAKVTDLSALREMPLTRLALRGTRVTDLSPLADCKALKTLVLPPNAKDIEFLRDFPKLERLGYNEATSEGGPAGQPAAEFWKDYDAMRWLWTIAGAAAKSKKLADGTWDVNLSEIAISDIKPLTGKRISKLGIGNTGVTELSALRGLPLTYLAHYNTKVTDLSPLAGMKLEHLHISGTDVADISVVRGMPLTRVRLHGCKKLTDVSPLSGLKDLTELSLPPNAKNFEFLRDRRTFPKLERLSFIEDEKTRLPDRTAAEFWKEYDAKKY